MAMMRTKTLHPPAGGTALISLSPAIMSSLGYGLLIPILSSSSLLVALAAIIGRIKFYKENGEEDESRRYPTGGIWF